MARPTNSTDSLLIDLQSRLGRLVEQARKEGHAEALAEVRTLLGSKASSKASPPKQRGKAATKAAKTTKSGKPRKNPWAGLSDKDRLKRVNAIRKGRGLPLKRKL